MLYYFHLKTHQILCVWFFRFSSKSMSEYVGRFCQEDGKYEFKLFDWRSGEWKVITIDDYLPCMAGSLEDLWLIASFSIVSLFTGMKRGNVAWKILDTFSSFAGKIFMNINEGTQKKYRHQSVLPGLWTPRNRKNQTFRWSDDCWLVVT